MIDARTQAFVTNIEARGHHAHVVPPFADPMIQVRTKDGQRFDLASGADGTLELYLVSNGLRLTPDVFDVLAVVRDWQQAAARSHGAAEREGGTEE